MNTHIAYVTCNVHTTATGRAHTHFMGPGAVPPYSRDVWRDPWRVDSESKHGGAEADKL
jgi:hypothetical protein